LQVIFSIDNAVFVCILAVVVNIFWRIKMTELQHTPGPWEYVPATEHHGPYVTGQFGNTIADCYTMTKPNEPSTLNGGESRPVHFLHEMADPNARLIAAAPDLLEALFDAQRVIAESIGDKGGILGRIEAAIAKAKGENQ
jgi:hypothetical protein